ncbi:MAG TPA: cytochrome c biogenesis protein CcsA [Alphaproteobacteria bacterium]|nr:cytochrome c biogenesis protein CcsA [Alphaproteobacteria bacterium]
MAKKPAAPLPAWLTPLAVVAMLALAAAGLIIFLQPHLNQNTARDQLLTQQLVPLLTALFVGAGVFGPFSLYRKSLFAITAFMVYAATGLAGGITLGIPYENFQVLEQGHWGMSNLYSVSVLTLFVIGTLSVVFDATSMPMRLIPFASPIMAAAALFSYWLHTLGASAPQELVPALQNAILPFHVLANFVGYGCFAVAAAVAVALLIKQKTNTPRLPSVVSLEKTAYRLIAIGFPVFTLAVLLGCLWAQQAWGAYWQWDPKETWALIVWLVYAGYLHVRLTQKPSSSLLAWWLLAGFAATLCCYIGVNLFLSGLHSYGKLTP